MQCQGPQSRGSARWAGFILEIFAAIFRVAPWSPNTGVIGDNIVATYFQVLSAAAAAQGALQQK